MIDTTAYRFRTAVGGFHKGDVAEYISKTAAQHSAQLKEYQDRIALLEQENENLRQQFFTTPLPDPAPIVPETAPKEEVSELELQAYRRAEATERLANQRAKKLYQTLEAICKDTEQEFSQTDSALAQAVQAVQEQAKAMEDAYHALSALLLHSKEQLCSMDAMMPDPAEELEAEAWLS